MTHASLFSGIGGAELAASWMGWDNVFHCEINPFGRKVIEYWFPKSKSYEDIKTTDFREWRGKIDVLTGGFPCQPFSQAGKRAGDKDDRYLWPEMLRAIREIQPEWVVGENVAGITSMVESGEDVEMGRSDNLFEESFIYRKEQQYTIERICKDFESIGYSIQPVLIPACSVGAPHRRDRVWFIAHTYGDGFIKRNRNDEKQSNKRGINALNDIEQISTSDTKIKQSKRSEFGKQSKISQQKQRESGGMGCEKYSSNSYDKRLQRSEKRRNVIEKESNEIKQPTGLFRETWSNFPTQSPVCRRNDGLPFNVDCLTIPFTKWRQESIKGYGNAMVPQVIYEIFKCINNI